AWLESLTASSGAGGPTYAASDLDPSPPPPLVDDYERRRSAMGVFTDDPEGEPPPLPAEDWEPVAAVDDEAEEADEQSPEDGSEEESESEREAEDEEPIAARTGRTRARPTAEPRAAEPDEPKAVAAAAPEPSSSEPSSRSTLDDRSRKLAMAVDRALGSARRRPGAEEQDVEPAPSKRRRARRSGGKAMSCEAAIAAYNEQWTIGGKKGPRDISAEQYGAVLNSGAYFRHCGVPGSTGVKICAAVQNGQAVGVTVTTSPRSAKANRCIANAVRGLSFPSHPRMDVTTTVFKPAR
ncbi:MAG: hypothetical protein JRI23_16650, partial [Deltaproteobacteria bacterium]|nr:hypothetical protein [Deltaproteobacteria bacterium]MBW2533406.1 hypothetical protein [Deltaproteobacteria bacterium]